MRVTLTSSLAISSLLATLSQAALQIVPGATWTATNTRNHIQAHGSGIINIDGVYYMVGEDKTEGSPFQNINCYSSADLVQWTFVNALLSRETDGNKDLGRNRVVERPKVVYNEKTQTYVMYLHIDDAGYQEAKVGVATSKTVCGNYEYLGSFRPLGFQSRDIGLFQDDDGSAYLLTEDRANGLRIDALSEDYLNVTQATYLWNKSIESPAILKRDGYYFMFGSFLTGWNANDNVYSYATSLAGPWSPWEKFADPGSNTYNSQTSFILPLGNSAIYMGDRWHEKNLMRSTYIWLPLDISGTKIRMRNRESWMVDVASKTWSEAPTSTKYEGESAVLANGARVINCSGCSQGKVAGWIGGPSNGTVTLSSVIAPGGEGQFTLRFQHVNGDQQQRWANVKFQNQIQKIAFLPTGDGNSIGSSVVHFDMANRDAQNSMEVYGFNDVGYGPDIDVISIPVA